MDAVMYIAIKVGPERTVLAMPPGYGRRILDKIEAVDPKSIDERNPNTNADIRITSSNYDGILDVLKQMDLMSYRWLRIRRFEMTR